MARTRRARRGFVLALTLLMIVGAGGAFSVLADGPYHQDPGDGGGSGSTCNCQYAGVCYSTGSCVQSVCASGKSQKCKSDGTWGTCELC